VQWKRLTGGCASELVWCEVDDRNRDVGCRIGERAPHVCYSGCVRRFPGDNYERRTACCAKRLTPWSGREKSWFSGPRIGANEQNVRIPSRTAMLERVVEDHDIDAFGDRLSDPPHPIGIRNHGDSLIQSLVHEDFIAAVAAQYDRGNRSHLRESAGEPRGDGRFTSAAHGQISHAQHGDRKSLRPKEPPVVQLAPRHYRRAVKTLQRREKRSRRTGAFAAPGPDSLDYFAAISHPPSRSCRPSSPRIAAPLWLPREALSRKPLLDLHTRQ